jgi:N-glycosylase/DNA lyase
MTDDIETIVAKMKILGYNGVSIMVDEFGPGAVFYPIPHDGKIRDISRGNTIKGAVEKAAKATGVME